MPLWSGSGTSNTLTDSRFTQSSTANIITGPSNLQANDSLRVQNLGGSIGLRVLGDGIVNVPNNYFHVSNSQGIYSDGAIKARGGVTDDQGTLGLGGSNSVNNLTLTSNTLATFAGDVSLGDAKFIKWGNGNQQILGNNTSGLSLYSNGERMRILTNGNVGIGTTGPATKLEVVGVTTSLGFRTDTTNTNWSLISRDSAGNSPLYVQSANSVTNQWIARFNYGSAIANGGDNVLTIAKDNSYFLNTNVGIGTTSPGGLLHVHQTGSGTSNSIITEDDARKIFIGRDSIKATDLSNNAAMLYLQQNGGNATLGGEVYIPSYIYHIGDTNTLFGFGGQDLFIINTGGGRRLTVTNTEATFENNLIVDGNVGIGTTSPGVKLQVGENTSGLTGTTSIFQEGGAEVGLYVKARVNRASLLVADNDTGVYISAEGGKGSFGRTQGVSTANINIDGSGNVGIGTISPGVKLGLSNSATLTAVYQQFTNGTTGTTSSDGTVMGIDSDGDFLINNQEAKEIKLYTSDSQRLTILSGGNVGIGTTVASDINEGKLYVNGTLALDQTSEIKYGKNSGGPYLNIRSKDGTTSACGIRIHSPVGSPGFLYGEGSGTTGSIMILDGAGQSVFSATQGNNTQLRVNNQTHLYINNSGNVGIGTTAPATWKLSVDSSNIYAASFDTSNNVGVVINGNNTTASQIIGFSNSNSTYNELHLRTNSTSTDGLYIDASGNVGIGTTAPGEKLEVVGNIRTNVGNGLGFMLTGSSASGLVRNAGTGLALRTNSIDKLIIDSTGSVTFSAYTGTNEQGTPTYLLGTDASGNIVKTNTVPGSGAGPYLPLSAGDSYPLTGALHFGDAFNYIVKNASSDMLMVANRHITFSDVISGAVNERMRIEEGGNVGIGTTSPDTKFNVTDGGTQVAISNTYLAHLQSASNCGLAITAGASSNNYIAFGDSDNYDEGIINYNNSTRSFAFRTADGALDDLVINSAGNVGIGLTDPDSRLDINAGVTNITAGPAVRISKGASPIGLIRYDTVVIEANDVATIRIGESDGTVSTIMSGDNNLRINSTDPIKFYTAGTTTGEGHAGQGGTFAMIIDNSQNVGIGTTSPGTINGVAFSSVGLHVNKGTLGRTITEGSQWGEYIMNHSGESANRRAKFIQSKSGDINIGSYDDNGTQRLHARLDNNGTFFLGNTSTAYQTVFFDSTPGTVYGNGTLQISPLTSPGSGIAQFTTNFADRVGGGTTKHNVRVGGTVTATDFIGGNGAYLPLAGGTMTGNTVHNDNVKSIYGTASDGLEVYHDGTDSIIADTGTGNLYIRGAASMRLQGINQSNFFIASQGGSVNLYYNNANKLDTTNTGINVTGDIRLNAKALLSNQENTDVDTGAEVVAQVSTSTYTAAFFDFVVKKGTNVRSGTVYACHDGTNVEFTETSTNDLGDTSDVTLSVDIVRN